MKWMLGIGLSILGGFVLGMWVMSEFTSRHALEVTQPAYSEGQTIDEQKINQLIEVASQSNAQSPQYQSELIVELIKMNRQVMSKLQTIEKRLDDKPNARSGEQSNEQVAELRSVTGDIIDSDINNATNTQAMNYLNQQINAGRWTKDNADYIQSMSDKLTKQQLIAIQISLNEAINSSQVQLEFDPVTHAGF